MRNILRTVVLAVWISGTGVQAQTQSWIECGENQTKIVSAVEWLIGCKDPQPIGSPTIYTAQINQRDMSTQVSHVLFADSLWNANTVPVRSSTLSQDEKGNFVYGNSQFSITPFNSSNGTGIGGTVVIGDKEFAIGWKIDATSNMKHGTIGFAKQINQGLTLSTTFSGAIEDAGIALGNKAYDGKILLVSKSILVLICECWTI